MTAPTQPSLTELIEAVCDVEAKADKHSRVADVPGAKDAFIDSDRYMSFLAGAQAVAIPLKAALLEALDFLTAVKETSPEYIQCAVEEREMNIRRILAGRRTRSVPYDVGLIERLKNPEYREAYFKELGYAPASALELAKAGWNQAKENHASEVERLKEKARAVVLEWCNPDFCTGTMRNKIHELSEAIEPKEPKEISGYTYYDPTEEP